MRIGDEKSYNKALARLIELRFQHSGDPVALAEIRELESAIYERVRLMPNPLKDTG